MENLIKINKRNILEKKFQKNIFGGQEEQARTMKKCVVQTNDPYYICGDTQTSYTFDGTWENIPGFEKIEPKDCIPNTNDNNYFV